MFRHPAKKLKVTAYLVFLLFAALGAAGGYLLLQAKQTVPAVMSVIAGLALAWILGEMVYGFGELIEKTKDNNYLLARIASHTKELQDARRD